MNVHAFWNNLLNAKKFVFPEFSYNQGSIQLHCLKGYIGWTDLYNIYDNDKELKGNLRKALIKLSYQVLQVKAFSFQLYYPKREGVSRFLNVIHTWSIISNSNKRYYAIPLGNVIVLNDSKSNFFHLLAFWI